MLNKLLALLRAWRIRRMYRRACTFRRRIKAFRLQRKLHRLNQQARRCLRYAQSLQGANHA